LGDETSDEVPRLGTLEFTLHKVNGHKMKATQFGDTAQQNDEGVSGHKKEAENHFLVYCLLINDGMTTTSLRRD
jgi:hypothetical protein